MLQNYLKDISLNLAKSGISNSSFEAMLILSYVLKCKTQDVVLNNFKRKLSSKETKLLKQLVVRRQEKEPLAYIFGEKEFWSLPFKVNNSTLIPRPESELILDYLTNLKTKLNKENLKILDLGTGSGCLLLSLLNHFKYAQGIGIDKSESAIKIAQFNANLLGLESRTEFIVSDWISAINSKFDLIVANPPYVRSSDIKFLDADIKYFEPALAINGGSDGLLAYNEIFGVVSNVLKKGCLFVFEIGNSQLNKIVKLLDNYGLTVVFVKKDLSRKPRCIIATI